LTLSNAPRAVAKLFGLSGGNGALLVGFWLLVLAAMPVWMHFDKPGWDVAIYHSAERSLAQGHDPYLDAIAVQKAFHIQLAQHANQDPPWSYVYSPLTLPLLKSLYVIPHWSSSRIYWLAYAVAVVVQIGVGLWAAKPDERRWLVWLAPVATFFPGLLANGIVLSGNIAYILYAMAFAAAIYAWKRASASSRAWLWFYVTVVFASCWKAPLLSLVVIPLLSARRQLFPVALTASVGAAIFLAQPLIWPALFKHYLEAVELQFSFNRDFGCSPAGLFSGILFDHHIPYSPAALIFYALYALPTLLLLVVLSRRYLAGVFSLRDWAPPLLVGVILLNPRLIEYDVAPLALPLGLILWRFTRATAAPGRTLLAVCSLLLAANALGLYRWEWRKLLDGPLLVIVFALGCHLLLLRPPNLEAAGSVDEQTVQRRPTALPASSS
jgi:hypothetical protein